MLTCQLMGGLGNQLFQIFATMAYALKTQQSYLFFNEDILYCGVPRKTYWKDFLANLIKYTYKTEHSWPTTKIENQCHEYKDITDAVRKQSTNFCKLVGYFQSYKYFEEYKENIYDAIKLREIKEEIKKEYSNLFQTDAAYYISMHFRLGDYKHVQHSHNLLPYEYYKKCLTEIINANKATHRIFAIHIFCEEEDNDLVFETIQKLNKELEAEMKTETEMQEIYLVFLKTDDTIEDWKQMLLMSLCNSNIIANSTFSWWGAYFNETENHSAYYPSKWFGPVLEHNYLGDMFPPEWHKIVV